MFLLYNSAALAASEVNKLIISIIRQLLCPILRLSVRIRRAHSQQLSSTPKSHWHILYPANNSVVKTLSSNTFLITVAMPELY